MQCMGLLLFCYFCSHYHVKCLYVKKKNLAHNDFYVAHSCLWIISVNLHILKTLLSSTSQWVMLGRKGGLLIKVHTLSQNMDHSHDNGHSERWRLGVNKRSELKEKKKKETEKVYHWYEHCNVLHIKRNSVIISCFPRAMICLEIYETEELNSS